METKELKDFDGHIVLYSKNWYHVKDVDLLTGLRRIWAIRCGLLEEHVDVSSYPYIADGLYKIIKVVSPERFSRLQETIHRDIDNNFRYENLTPIERIIHIYMSEISGAQIRENRGKGYKALVKLPKPQKRLFKRIVRGNGEYQDYWSVVKKETVA